jgi:predicted transcriptional regulator
MAKRKARTVKLKAMKLLADPRVKAAYDALAPQFAIARSVIRARRRAGLTQAELAARMETSQSYVARLESGRTLPTMRTFLRIAAATRTKPKFSLEAE